MSEHSEHSEARYSREELHAGVDAWDIPHPIPGIHHTIDRACDEADRMREAEHKKQRTPQDTWHYLAQTMRDAGVDDPERYLVPFDSLPAPEPEGVWVRVGDRVYLSNIGVPGEPHTATVVGQDPENADRLVVRINVLWPPYQAIRTSSLRTLDGRPVLGVRVGEFTKEQVREIVQRFWYTRGGDDRPVEVGPTGPMDKAYRGQIDAVIEHVRKGRP